MVMARKHVVVSILSIITLTLIILLPLIAAHADSETPLGVPEDWGMMLKYRALLVIVIVSIISIVLVIIALLVEKKSERTKWILFLGISIPIAASTLFSAGTTIYLNIHSESGGPVHWHVDYEIWNCGNKVDLVDPTGLSNRLGSPIFHEHGDERLHLEGVVVQMKDARLHHFFELVGITSTQERMTIPTNDGQTELSNGQICNGEPGKLQFFLLSIVNPDERGNWTMTQRKLDDVGELVMAPYTHVPPGDCLIIEFDREKDRTERLCASYRLAKLRGELNGG